VTAVLYLLLFVSLTGLTFSIWATVQAPGQGLSYLQLAWSLLVVAFPVSLLASSPWRVIVLIITAGNLAGLAVFLWKAAHAPGDWVNYFMAAPLLPLLLAVWLRSRWARSGRHAARRVAD
jgi:hypothetical protein